jgi:hypothetical protein
MLPPPVQGLQLICTTTHHDTDPPMQEAHHKQYLEKAHHKVVISIGIL